MDLRRDETIKRIRMELEERGVLNPKPPEDQQERRHGLKRSALDAYRQKFGRDYVLQPGEFVIEDQ